MCALRCEAQLPRQVAAGDAREGAIGVGPRLQPLVLEFLRDRVEVLPVQRDRLMHRPLVRVLRTVVHLQRLRAVLAAKGGAFLALVLRQVVPPLVKHVRFATNHAAEVAPGLFVRAPPLDATAQRSTIHVEPIPLVLLAGIQRRPLPALLLV